MIVNAKIVNANIFIIRHAEQQKEGVQLNRMGFARAEAYSKYLLNYKADGQHFAFNHLIACGDIPIKSVRPKQTLIPLAKELAIEIDARFTENEPLIETLYTNAQYSNSNTLICWRHRKIVDLYEQIAKRAVNSISKDELAFPSQWPNDVFGWIIRLNFNAKGELDLTESGATNLQLMYDDFGKNP